MLIILFLFSSIFQLGASVKPLFLPLVETSAIYDLKLNSELSLHWQIDWDNNELIFEVTYTKPNSNGKAFKDWIGIGFSDYGEPQNADLCILWTDWKGRIFLEDVHTNLNETQVIEDESQDCSEFHAQVLPRGGVTFTFRRKFNTCDPDDYIIEDGTTHVIWATGNGPLYSLNNINIGSPNLADFGFTRTRLLKVDIPTDFPKDSQLLEIRHSVELPSDDTTYWCSIHKLPSVFSQKHHAIQYEPIKAKGNEHLLHHMEVFHCVPQPGGDSNDFPLWSGPCGSAEAPAKLSQCKKVLAAWAIGAGPFTYPPEAGLTIGGEDFGSLYVMLEVHYNNEGLQSGVKDNSGMRFVVTQHLRPFDAGIMELGLVYTDKMAIPPQQHSFPLHGYCLPECSAVGFPSEGITIFGSQLHTHGTGFQVETRHFREGQELSEVNRDNHYSTHFQEIRSLRKPAKVLPGDELVTSCWYSTMDKDRATVGGFTFADEMCVNYIHYFPRAESLEVCKSSVDGQALNDYFDFLAQMDGQNTDSKGKNVTDNYHSIDWTPLRASALLAFYDEAPIEMQCQSGAGSALPGKWHDMQKPLIDLTAKKPLQNCLPGSSQSFISPNRRLSLLSLLQPPKDDKKSAFSPAPNESIYYDKKIFMNKRNQRKKSGSPFNEMRKRAGSPLNEMRRKKSGQATNEMKKSDISLHELIKKRDEEIPMGNYQNVPSPLDDISYDTDFSQFWSDYDSFGYDKRGLGSMRKKKKNGSNDKYA